MCVQRPLSTDSLSRSYALALSLHISLWLSGLCRLVWLFPFPFCTLSTCATVAACCSLLCACSSCRLAFLFQAKKDEAMSEIFATLSLPRSLTVSLSLSLWPLKLDSKVKFCRGLSGWGLWSSRRGWFSLLVLVSAFVSLQRSHCCCCPACCLLLFVLAFHSQTVSKFCTFCAFIFTRSRRRRGRVAGRGS